MPYLQKALPQHAQYWYALLEQDHARLEEWLPHLREIRSIAEAEAYINQYARSDFYLGEHIYELWQDQHLVGLLSVHNGRMLKKSADIGYWIGSDYAGQGITAAACQLIFSKLFDSTPLQVIYIRCTKDNLASQAVARKLGMTLLDTKVETKETILSFGMTKATWLATGFDEEDLLHFIEEEE